jgi:hypothetical protein
MLDEHRVLPNEVLRRNALEQALVYVNHIVGTPVRSQFSFDCITPTRYFLSCSCRSLPSVDAKLSSALRLQGRNPFVFLIGQASG